MSFFCNVFISQPINLKFGRGTQNWILILILDSKSGLGNDFGQYDTKFLLRFFGQTSLRCLKTTQFYRIKSGGGTWSGDFEYIITFAKV